MRFQFRFACALPSGLYYAFTGRLFYVRFIKSFWGRTILCFYITTWFLRVLEPSIYLRTHFTYPLRPHVLLFTLRASFACTKTQKQKHWSKVYIWAMLSRVLRYLTLLLHAFDIKTLILRFSCPSREIWFLLLPFARQMFFLMSTSKAAERRSLRSGEKRGKLLVAQNWIENQLKVNYK